MKTIFLLLFSLFTLPVCAQLSIGVIGGYSHATQRISGRTFFPAEQFASPNPSADAKARYTPHWHGGLVADLRLFKGFYIQPQVLISSKGLKEEESWSLQHWVAGTYKTRLIYLEIPLNLVYKFRMGPGKLAIGAGPYFAFPLSGTYRDEGTITDPNQQRVGGFGNEQNIQFDDFVASTAAGKYYKNSDAGINFIAGYEFKKWIIIQYQL